MSVTVYIDIMKQTWCSIAQSRTRTNRKKNWLFLKTNIAVYLFYVFLMCLFHFVFFVATNERQPQQYDCMYMLITDRKKKTAIKTVWQVKYATMFSCNFKRRNNPIKYCDNEYAMSIPIAQRTHFLFGSEKL